MATRDQAEVLARIAGRLVRLSVSEGDTVTRGQRIGTVVDERIGYETRAYQAQVAAASAEAVRARAELARIDYLYRNNVYAKARLADRVEILSGVTAGDVLLGASAGR